MRTYRTAEVAELIGIHPNTVRLYEGLGLITKPERLDNGYRVFTQLNITQFKIARLAFEVEVLQNGLRKKAAKLVKTCAAGDVDGALELTQDYLEQLEEEKRNAGQAIEIAQELTEKAPKTAQKLCLTRKETAQYLKVTMDTLRNWELNGLLDVKRKQNGYRVYSGEDIRRLRMIKSLRCANYSLSSILRMLSALSSDPETDIRTAIDTSETGDIVTACDSLITSLEHARSNMLQIKALLLELRQDGGEV